MTTIQELTNDTTPKIKKEIRENLDYIKERSENLRKASTISSEKLEEAYKLIDEHIEEIFNQDENSYFKDNQFFIIQSDSKEAKACYYTNFKIASTEIKSLKEFSPFPVVSDNNFLQVLCDFRGENERQKELRHIYEGYFYDKSFQDLEMRFTLDDIRRVSSKSDLSYFQKNAKIDNYTLDQEDLDNLDKIEDILKECTDIIIEHLKQADSNKYFQILRKYTEDDKEVYQLTVALTKNFRDFLEDANKKKEKIYSLVEKPKNYYIALDKTAKYLAQNRYITEVEIDFRDERKGIKQASKEITTHLKIISSAELNGLHFTIMNQLYSYKKEGIKTVSLEQLIQDTQEHTGRINNQIKANYVKMLNDIMSATGISTTGSDTELRNVINISFTNRQYKGKDISTINILEVYDDKGNDVSFPLLMSAEELHQISYLPINQAKAINKDKYSTGDPHRLNNALNQRILHAKHVKKFNNDKYRKITYQTIYDVFKVDMKQEELANLTQEEIRKKKKSYRQDQRRSIDKARNELKHKVDSGAIHSYYDNTESKYFWIYLEASEVPKEISESTTYYPKKATKDAKEVKENS